MIKYIFIIFLVINFSLDAREIGETEITTEEGIEVYQDEKYYLLKKNVKIDSDSFTLLGDLIKIFFSEDMYDIQNIDAQGNVELTSQNYGINAKGINLNFNVSTEEIIIKGLNSELITQDSEMYSDGEIFVNNKSGKFIILGKNSKLINEDIYIKGNYIDGIFINSDNNKNIKNLNVEDNNLSYIKTETTEMYAKNITYSKANSIIELHDNVKIIRDGEIIEGDYGRLNTITNSYKVQSKDKNKVKVIIKQNNE